MDLRTVRESGPGLAPARIFINKHETAAVLRSVRKYLVHTPVVVYQVLYLVLYWYAILQVSLSLLRDYGRPQRWLRPPL